MEPFRLRLKVGPHEFEAEGDQETVERQLAVWREMVAAAPSPMQLLASPPPAGGGVETPPDANPEGRTAGTNYDKIFRHDGRLVSLSILPNGEQREADAALLLLLGQRVYNNQELVTGGQILDGLARSGLTGLGRADWVLGEHVGPNVIRAGARRGVTYRLTNPGMARAEELVRELVGMVP